MSTDANAPSRQGRFPAIRVSLAIGRTEFTRTVRTIRAQDVWLAFAVIGGLALVLSMPLVFGLAREYALDLETGAAPFETAVTIFGVWWVGIAALAVISGVGSEGEIDNAAAVLTARPPKDAAGGLTIAIALGYAPFVVVPAMVGGAGLAVGAGTPVPLVGIAIASVCLLVSGVVVGYAVGLWLKGTIRRSPWLSRLKPLLGASVIVGYVWLVFTDRLSPVIDAAGDILANTPVGWMADLALLTTPHAAASPLAAVGVVLITAAVVPLGLLAVVRAGEYTWYVDPVHGDDGDSSRETAARQSRLEAGLSRLPIHPVTRGVAVVSLIRGYRAPLTLVYVVVPLVLAVPAVEPAIRTGAVPEWVPWMVVLYGAWVAGVLFPLNLLGNQGGVLPTLLTSPAPPRRVVDGTLLASVLVVAPATVAAGVGVARLSERSPEVQAVVGVAGVVAVIAGAVLAAGIGAVFPRFTAIDITGSTRAVLPSKMAFVLFSLAAGLATSAVGILADDLYRLTMASMLTDVLPYGIVVEPDLLEAAAVFGAGVVLVAVPLAYLAAIYRLETYRL